MKKLSESLAKHSYLWETPDRVWGLKVTRKRNGTFGGYLIVNLVEHFTVLIDDDELASAVQREMLAHNCPVVDAG